MCALTHALYLQAQSHIKKLETNVVPVKLGQWWPKSLINSQGNQDIQELFTCSDVLSELPGTPGADPEECTPSPSTKLKSFSTAAFAEFITYTEIPSIWYLQ